MIPRLLGRATARIQRPRSLAVLGGTALALALGVAFLPWLFPAAVFRPLSGPVASPAAIVTFGAAAGLLGAQALRETATGAVDGEDGRPDRWTPDRPPERAHYDEYRTTGTEVDAVFDVTPGESQNLASRRRKAYKRIRETAISVVADVERVDRETAAGRVAEGSWTDDPRAAAFLGGRDLAPLRTRIRDWASGEHFERWASRAVAEIEALDRGDVSGRERIEARDRPGIDETDEIPTVEDPTDVFGPGVTADAAEVGDTTDAAGTDEPAEADERTRPSEGVDVPGVRDGEADREREVAGR